MQEITPEQWCGGLGVPSSTLRGGGLWYSCGTTAETWGGDAISASL